jgi:DNA/RNA-binding domain of Phe-tRNA-synthetase-like protein
MRSFPPQVRHELEGWVLFWADLEPTDCPAETLAALRRDVAARVRASFDLERLSKHATVAGVRRLFRLAGCDPTRHRPASEAMLRRLLKGEELPAIHPLVDLNNCLSAELAVPVCMMDRERLAPPFVWRAGQRGESMMSLKGPFNVDAKPLLLDQEGPVDVPITGSERVKITPATRRAWLVAYLPDGVLDPKRAEATLSILLTGAPVARLRAAATTPHDA